MNLLFLLESAEKLQSELRELRVQHYTLKEQHDELKEKMKFFTKVIFAQPFFPLYFTVMTYTMIRPNLPSMVALSFE